MKNKGFTLIEIIVVVALIAIISTVVIVNMTGVQQNTIEVDIKRFKEKISNTACQYLDKGSNLILSSNSNCTTDTRLTTRDDCKENGDGCFVCLKTLIEEGLVDQEEIDPSNNKKLKDESTAVRVRVKWINDNGSKKKVCEFVDEDAPQTTLSVSGKKRKVFFNYTSGTGTETQREVEENKKIGTLPKGTKTGYMIDYWYYFGDESRHASANDTMGNSDISLLAHWASSSRTLKYDSQGGSSCPDKTGTYDSTWGTLCTTTRSGYEFIGWYTGINGSGTEIKSSSKVENNLTVYAKWTVSTSTLTYDSQGGSYCQPKTVNNGGTWGTLCTPTRSGYDFKGWYTGTSGTGTRIRPSSPVSGNQTVYAKWNEKTCSITRQKNDGIADHQDSWSNSTYYFYTYTATYNCSEVTGKAPITGCHKNGMYGTGAGIDDYVYVDKFVSTSQCTNIGLPSTIRNCSCDDIIGDDILLP